MVNVWKISTLALTGILIVVVGQGAVQKSEACDTGSDEAAQQTELRLSAALTFLDRAEMQIKAAPAARPLPRQRALDGIELAKAEVKMSLAPPPPPPPRRLNDTKNAKIIFF
jgi:hypothetical protein